MYDHTTTAMHKLSTPPSPPPSTGVCDQWSNDQGKKLMSMPPLPSRNGQNDFIRQGTNDSPPPSPSPHPQSRNPYCNTNLLRVRLIPRPGLPDAPKGPSTVNGGSFHPASRRCRRWRPPRSGPAPRPCPRHPRTINMNYPAVLSAWCHVWPEDAGWRGIAAFHPSLLLLRCLAWRRSRFTGLRCVGLFARARHIFG